MGRTVVCFTFVFAAMFAGQVIFGAEKRQVRQCLTDEVCGSIFKYENNSQEHTSYCSCTNGSRPCATEWEEPNERTLTWRGAENAWDTMQYKLCSTTFPNRRCNSGETAAIVTLNTRSLRFIVSHALCRCPNNTFTKDSWNKIGNVWQYVFSCNLQVRQCLTDEVCGSIIKYENNSQEHTSHCSCTNGSRPCATEWEEPNKRTLTWRGAENAWDTMQYKLCSTTFPNRRCNSGEKAAIVTLNTRSPRYIVSHALCRCPNNTFTQASWKKTGNVWKYVFSCNLRECRRRNLNRLCSQTTLLDQIRTSKVEIMCQCPRGWKCPSIWANGSYRYDEEASPGVYWNYCTRV